MTIRAALLLVGFGLLATLTFAQGNRFGSEAEGAKDGHAAQQGMLHEAPVEMPPQAIIGFAQEGMPTDVIAPVPPQPVNFWEEILPVCAVIAAIWLTFLILGLTLSSSVAAGIFLLIAAWTALFGIGALLLVILALVQLSSRSRRVARRAHDPMWRMKRWRSR